MRIRFDVDFDGYPWPGPLQEKHAAFGETWVGPRGFLDLLETQLGLTGLAEPDIIRAAALVPAVRHTPGFWTQSATVDPLGVARTLLQWRDELCSGGWRGQGLSPRLKDLASLRDAIIGGTPDRLARVTYELSRTRTDIQVLELFEERSQYPQLWRNVFAALETSGTQIIEIVPGPAVAIGDLLAARKAGFIPKRDGSLQLLRPQGPQIAANTVAAWLANQENLAGTVIVGADSLLDTALVRHGLPAIGATAGRCDTSLLEILPLVIEMGWSPSDPARALELLTLPTSPVPRGIRGRLVGVLKQWPAIDSDSWREALREGVEKVEDEKDRKRIRERLAVLLLPKVTGSKYPVSELRLRAKTLMNWLQGILSAQDPEREEYKAAMVQCSNFIRLVEVVGMDTLNRPQLHRLLEDAADDVNSLPQFDAQAGLFGVSTPGAIGGPVQRVVWWNFTRNSAPKPETLPLTPAERAALVGAGVSLPEPTLVAVGMNARWSRPLQFTESALMLVCPKYGDDGEEQQPHPLWDQIAARAANDRELNKLIVQTPVSSNEPKQRTQDLLPKPQPRREWRLPDGMIIPPREVESPSGAGALVGCPFQWALQYAGEVNDGDTADLPAEEKLVGLVAHEILARVLRSDPKTPDAAERDAERLFDIEGPRLATILFMPGLERLKQQSRRATGRAAKILVKYLKETKLGVVAIEKTFEGLALGTRFEGRTDLVVGPPNVVIDLKWDGEKYRKSELQNGAPYQLAAYSQLNRMEGYMPPVAFFIIRTQRMLTTHMGLFSGVTPLEGPPPGDVWNALERSYKARLDQLRGGQLLAPGDRDDHGQLDPAESRLVDGTLLLTPPCHYCPYGLLCGHGLKVDPSIEHPVKEGA